MSKLFLCLCWKAVHSKIKEECMWNGLDTLSRETTMLSFFFVSFLERKKKLPIRSKFFPFRADPFFEVDRCAEKWTGSHKSCLPRKNGLKCTKFILSLKASKCSPLVISKPKGLSELFRDARASIYQICRIEGNKLNNNISHMNM